MSNSKYCSYQRVLLLLVGVVLLSGVGCGSKKKDGVGKAGLGQGASGLELEWVRIEGGSFEMGADDEDSHSTEQPVHQVTVPTFEMTKTEVTFRQYESCVDAGACTAAHVLDGTCQIWNDSIWRFGKWKHGKLPSRFQGDDQPVVCVNWHQAQAFAKWAGGRLPTEAEWEYAARSGGQNQKYPWGNEEANRSLAVMSEDGWGGFSKSTRPVCSKPKGNTAQGLCDMAGNASEWVQDWFHDNYEGAPTDGSAWEQPAGSYRVLRGGAWGHNAKGVRSAYRLLYDTPSDSFDYMGFRIARSVQ